MSLNNHFLTFVKSITLLLCVAFGSNYTSAQMRPEVTGFSSPLEIPLYLAGSFAELRSNHFHSGLDIKTQGREGLKVLSIEEGYVSRIKVSAFGYGKAIYVRHANGYTSVYAHLKKFNDEIEAYVKKVQYEKRSFKVEIYPKSSELRVKKGDLIAISGNSGSSSAPHLHFELRESDSEAPVNPLLFGFDIKDDISPELTSLYIYPRSDIAVVNGRISKQKVGLVKENGVYRLSSNATIKSFDNIGLGLEMFDRLNEVNNKCGIYEIKLFKNEELIYHHKMDKFHFHETRYLNALVDYKERVKNKKWIHRSFILPNNKLSIYPERLGNGEFIVEPGTQDEFRYEISDTYGNKSHLEFEITGVTAESRSQEVISQKPIKRFKYNEANSFEEGDIMVYMPANILYEDLDFNFWIGDTLERCVAPLYHVHDLYTPLQSHMAVSIRLKKIPSELRRYALIVSQDKKERLVPEGGYWKGDYLIVKTRSLGPYSVRLDTVKPKLTPVNIPSSKDMSRKWSIVIKAEDNLSGVHRYNAYIDDKWVLMEFDYKKKRLIHYFEDDLEKGEHQFKIVVKDKIGNENSYETAFTR